MRTQTLDSSSTYIDELEALVRWLAEPYGENAPLFTSTTEGRMMAALYAEVTGTEPALPGDPGVPWVVAKACTECGHLTRMRADA
jgi:hypothetical protein